MMRTCLNYHRETSYDRHRMGGHFLDWANQLAVFKIYEGLPSLKLPKEVELPRRKILSLFLERSLGEPPSGLDLAGLSALLLLTNTLTAKARSQKGDFYFRSAASAGALYPTEVYTATLGVDGSTKCGRKNRFEPV